jgi:hypothetical protein
LQSWGYLAGLEDAGTDPEEERASWPRRAVPTFDPEAGAGLSSRFAVRRSALEAVGMRAAFH